MTTRKRSEGKPPSQQGYASSAEFDRGLLANLVAMRCELLEAAADRELIFAIQHASHQPGGLRKLACLLIESYPDQVATLAMQRMGMKSGQVYNASQVREVRGDIPDGEDRFLLKGELSWMEWTDGDDETVYSQDLATGRTEIVPNPRLVEARANAAKRPASYPAEEFARACQFAAREQLAGWLEELCLNPARPSEGRWFFPNLIQTLRAHFQKRAEAVSQRLAETAITRQVFAALDYSLAGDGITLINGLARTGKTYAIKAWCEQRPGLARYVQVPPTADDGSFFRRIAEALGVSTALSMKSVQLRERVECTARSAKLAIVLDEGHYLVSQDYRCRKRPTRIAWIMNELVNYGVPVVICTTPQFQTDKAKVQDRTGWAWEQFDGRIGHYAALDEILCLDDLKAVARIHLPELDSDGILGVATYAQASSSYVAGIEHVAKRARYTASQAGRERVTSKDIFMAIKARSSLDLNRTVPAVAAPEPKPITGRRVTTPAVSGLPASRITALESVPVC